ncbi:MAG: hypothetical protein Q8N80_05965, partial [Candidatus Omnitrophota bacterium]|nr:hypothetical protein [Candidatus Omnitrophota bacterium]
MRYKKILTMKQGDGSTFFGIRFEKSRTVPFILCCVLLLSGCAPEKAKEKPQEAIPVKVDK